MLNEIREALENGATNSDKAMFGKRANASHHDIALYKMEIIRFLEPLEDADYSVSELLAALNEI